MQRYVGWNQSQCRTVCVSSRFQNQLHEWRCRQEALNANPDRQSSRGRGSPKDFDDPARPSLIILYHRRIKVQCAANSQLTPHSRAQALPHSPRIISPFQTPPSVLFPSRTTPTQDPLLRPGFSTLPGNDARIRPLGRRAAGSSVAGRDGVWWVVV